MPLSHQFKANTIDLMLLCLYFYPNIDDITLHLLPKNKH